MVVVMDVEDEDEDEEAQNPYLTCPPDQNSLC
jgi:hypothetical protein